ncbi:CCC motif membrane protein [Aestuariibaculum sp. M13]|uniref:CCC motif membrane protein n=1 Tax=Aestuariibaculum sp. M13 TaxID=2967132 RepID=UPI002159E685|nr:CCC motif membrane protein [Aestuariibaculum sp. M13]MCR8669361.1 CCC motif membrane protein [Aestuariibaculum sp. M13]
MEQQKLPNSTLILVLGIVSILTCCCYGFVGLIVGIITLVLASKATSLYLENTELYTGYSNVKTGKILAIVGIVLSVLYLLMIVWAIATFGWDAMGDQELLQERMQEFMGQ